MWVWTINFTIHSGIYLEWLMGLAAEMGRPGQGISRYDTYNIDISMDCYAMQVCYMDIISIDIIPANYGLLCRFVWKLWIYHENVGENDDTLLISQFGASNFWRNLNSWKTRYSVHYLSDVPILGHFWLVAAEGSMILLVWFRIMRSFVKRTFCLPRFKCLWDAISAIIVFIFVIRFPLFKPFFCSCSTRFFHL